MDVLHISAECYPAAKAGGLGDVVGALPKYLQQVGVSAGVVLPKYRTRWINEHFFLPIYRGAVRLHNTFIQFTVEQAQQDALGFPFFVVDIPGKFDRAGIYGDSYGGYGDEVERSLCFQQAVLQWIAASPGKPLVLHCHDHHTGLIPWMVQVCPEYQSLTRIPTIFTIHNGSYHGNYSWDKLYLLPFFLQEGRGFLDWGNTINPLAAAVKCAWRVTTVSPSYMEELRYNSNGMEALFQYETAKSVGILNGIDAQVWNPYTDEYLVNRHQGDVQTFKSDNKRALLQRFQIEPTLPIFTFIGRLVMEKGADLLPDLITRVLENQMRVNFVILGTGERWLMERFAQMRERFRGRFDASLEYNEGLAHQLYAGSDFLLMPSRVEPCGLNQMYAMRYGTLPIVRKVGGLKDTVPDIGEPDGSGRGIQFTDFTLDDSFKSIYRAADLYHNRPDLFKNIQQQIMQVDFSWERSAGEYVQIYREVL